MPKITNDAIGRLGTCLDSVLAAQCGVSVSAVTQQRKKRGIPPFRLRGKYRRWTITEVVRLGKTPDAETAAVLSRKKKTVRSKRLRMSIAVSPHPTIIDLARACLDFSSPAV